MIEKLNTKNIFLNEWPNYQENYDNFNKYDVINKRSQCLNSASKLESYQIKSRRKLSLIESDSDNTKTQTLKINHPPPIQYSFNVFEIFLITFCKFLFSFSNLSFLNFKDFTSLLIF